MSPRPIARGGMTVAVTVYLTTSPDGEGGGITAAVEAGNMSTVPRVDEIEVFDSIVARTIATVTALDPEIVWRRMTDAEVKDYLKQEEEERRANQHFDNCEEEEED